jgi:hypothetical protein
MKTYFILLFVFAGLNMPAQRLVPFREGDHWGFQERATGEIIVNPIYNDVGDFRHNDLAEVRLDGKLGFIDSTGQLVIPMIYEDVRGWGSYYIVKRNGKWGYVDRNAKEIIPCRYDEIGFDVKGYIVAKGNGKYGMIDMKGDTILPFVYEYLTNDCGQPMLFSAGKKYGAIDLTGKEAIPPVYDQLGCFWYNIAPACIGGAYNPKKYEWEGGKWGYVDRAGKVVIPFIYDDLGEIYEGTIQAKKDGKTGFLDTAGNVIANTMRHLIFPTVLRRFASVANKTT